MSSQKYALAPMTPPRQRKRTPTTAPCIHDERRQKLIEWRASDHSRDRLHKLKPVNLFPSSGCELGLQTGSFLTSCQKIFVRPETLLTARSFSRGRTRSFCASMAEGADATSVDGIWPAETNPINLQDRPESSFNTGYKSFPALEVGKKRRRQDNVCSFTPNTDTIEHSSTGVLQNTPQRSHVLMHKLRNRSQKSRLQDVLFDGGDGAAIQIS